MVRLATVLAGGLTIVALIGAAQAGILASDANALGTWQGTKTFDTADTFGVSYFVAEIDYAVYAPGNFAASFTPQTGAEPAVSDYVYAYQIVSVADGTTGSGHVERLSVGLNDGNEQPNVIGYLPTDPAEVAPSDASFAPNTAGWNFLNPNVHTGDASMVLYFSSPFGPEWDTATASGTFSTFDTKLMPSPTPEPATVLLLSIGAGALLRRRRA